MAKTNVKDGGRFPLWVPHSGTAIKTAGNDQLPIMAEKGTGDRAIMTCRTQSNMRICSNLETSTDIGPQEASTPTMASPEERISISYQHRCDPHCRDEKEAFEVLDWCNPQKQSPACCHHLEPREMQEYNEGERQHSREASSSERETWKLKWGGR